MSKLLETLNASKSKSPLMVDREKIDTDDIIKYYPDGITLEDYDTFSMEKDGATEEITVYTFKEEPKKFAFAGAMLKLGFNALEETFENAHEELRKGNIKAKLSTGKTKDGKQITNVEYIEE